MSLGEITGIVSNPAATISLMISLTRSASGRLYLVTHRAIRYPLNRPSDSVDVDVDVGAVPGDGDTSAAGAETASELLAASPDLCATSSRPPEVLDMDANVGAVPGDGDASAASAGTASEPPTAFRCVHASSSRSLMR